ncbi:hypothetical protein AUC71_14700 [Methyloceanibacter marginalis]|uniref:DUF2019 domain-containing protein n=1 Tax=Methyloceanibacter marginalis TaxID=1774971 RepID=A0A1E3W9M9_9HYPH|nr:DUF2019 domain-containing protein [Methyloceanibacter marginalis]ODS02535.1 hypothetical protein AUC71_14700 [Methyloceanibacter marginalis]
MKRSPRVSDMTAEELVAEFASISVAQDDALLDADTSGFNRLFQRLESVEAELKGRPGDQRQALLSLYDHENDQVRLNAANATLAVSPKDARALLEAIAESGVFPQRGDAGMALWALDEGISEPT